MFVFLFFGVVAVVGSYYVQTEDLEPLALSLAVPVGLLSAAILMVNNIRDLDTDRRAGKRTLAVRLGRPRAVAVFGGTLSLAFAWMVGVAIGEGEPWLVLPWLAVPLVPALRRTVATRTDGPSLNAALARCGMLLALFSLLLSAGLLLSK